MMRTRCTLILVISFVLLLPLEATMEVRGLFLESEQLELIGEVNSAAPWHGGTLLGSSTGIYYFSENHDTADPVQLHPTSQPNVVNTLTAILTESDKAYALSLSEGCLWPINIDGAELKLGNPLCFDTSPFRIAGQDGVEHILTPAQVLIAEETLCVLTRFMHDLGGSLLITIDTNTGEVRSLPQIPGQVISHLSTYVPGKILALEQAGAKMGVQVVDLTTGSQKPFASLDESLGKEDTAILFVPEEDMLYILSGMRLFTRNASGKLTETAYFNIGSGMFIRFGRLGRFNSGQLTVAHPEGMAVGSRMDALQQPLVILGLNEQDPIHTKVRQKMGNTPLQPLQYDYGEVDAKLAEVMVGGLSQPDVLTFFADDIDSFRMMKKGYVVDLSSQEELVTFVKTTYPRLQDLCFYEGQLCFLPIDVQFGGISIDPGAFEQIGITSPASLPDLITLVASWPEQADLWDGVSLLSGAHPRAWLVDAIWRSWLADCAAMEAPLRLQDMRLEKLLNQVTQIDWAAWPPQSTNQSVIPLFPRVWEDSADLRHWTRYQNANKAGELLKGLTSLPLPLSIDNQETAVLPLRVKLMGINPHSQQTELAIKYLISYVQSISAQQHIRLSPNKNEPLANPEHPKMIELAEESLRLATEALEQATNDADLSFLRERVEQARKLVNYWHQAPPLVSEEAIQIYQNLISYGHVLTYQNMGGAARDSLKTLLGRFSLDTIAVDEIIREGDRILKLALTEGE